MSSYCTQIIDTITQVEMIHHSGHESDSSVRCLRRQERFADLFGCGNTSGLKPSKTQDGNPATNPGNSTLDGKKLGVDVSFI